jgi:hypothetical protein
MNPRALAAVAIFVGAIFALSCGRSDLVDSVDPGGSAGVTGGAGGAGGSGGAAPDLSGLCTRACKKIVDCAFGVITQPACVTQCVTGGMQTCPNFAEVFSMTDQCIARPSCLDFEACLNSIPPCQGTTTPTGGAGTTGTGSNAACQSVCARAVTCCQALSPTSDCGVLSTTCATSGDPASAAMGCQSLLTVGATVPQGAPFCK